jgi:FkbM family methyltransferase
MEDKKMKNSAAFMYIYFRNEALKYSKTNEGRGFSDFYNEETSAEFRANYLECNRPTSNLLVNFSIALLNSLEIERFFEFGAAGGYTSRSIAVANSNINCYAFEANPYHHQHISSLKHHEGIKNLNYINAAISNVIPIVDFNIPIYKSTVNDFAGGIFSTSSSVLKSLDSDPELLEIKTVSCKSYTIDQVLNSSEPLSGRSCFWLDIEGYALQALKTCSDYENVDLIYTEMHDSNVWENQTKNIELIDFLISKNFVPFSFDCENIDQINALFISNKSIGKVYASGLAHEYLSVRQRMS